jgi:glycosyltransferase involved in cell wall biosynthesis
MKLLRITRLYPNYIRDFYRKNHGLSGMSYGEQKKILDYDAFGWSDYWLHALSPLGYEVQEVTLNAEPLQRAWARENHLPNPTSLKLDEIAVAQARKFEPEILWFEDYSEELLKSILFEIPSVRLVLGWVGSAIPRTDIWRRMDLVLSCAQESVECLRKAGFPTAQLHHGFDPRINGRLAIRPKKIDVSFVGQLIREERFHRYREQLLEAIALKTNIEIFSPSADLDWKDDGMTILKAGCYVAARMMKSAGVPESTIKAIPVIGKAAEWPSRPAFPANRKLKPFMKPAVFGLDMFQVLRDSNATLNIHADSSPVFASNMRLFEATGVGTCLITDWKKNLQQLFEPDKEIVVYESAEEMVEKTKWLLNHPREREEIASAGKERTMKDHTYARRAEQLNLYIMEKLGK